MTDSEQKEEASTGGGPAEPGGPEPAPRKRGLGSWLFATLALLVALGAAAASGWVWYQGEQRLAAQSERLDTVERGLESNVQDLLLPRLKKLESRVSGLSERDAGQAETLASLRERLEATRVQISELAELVEGGNRRWRLLEIESLLLAANERLQLHRDQRGAKQALNLASRRLAAFDDPRLFGVRQRVVDEIAALEALPEPDIEGMALNLAQLIERLPDLPLASDVPGDYAGAGNGEQQQGTPFRERPWRHFLDSMREALRGMVTVRRTDEAHQPLMPPEQEFFLYQNLRLKLESARLALLRRQTPAYRDAVTTARDWLGTYFDREDARVAAAIETLEGMRKVQLAWEAPDISGSLTALRDLLRREAGAGSGNGETAADGDDG